MNKKKLLAGVLVATVGVGLLLTPFIVWSGGPDPLSCSMVSYDGEGTEANPYEVENVEQLQCIGKHDRGANYVQVSDIDASETASWNGGKGFDPIGWNDNGFSYEFGGTYDGQGYNITNLTINREDGGLFRVNDGKITNVSLVNVDITGSSLAGALAAYNVGKISNSRATGSVEGSEEVGGLVGTNIKVQAIIKKSYASVSVEGPTAGGLVGDNAAGRIIKSYATGSVDGGTAGGLVGRNDVGGDIVVKSYATGSVESHATDPEDKRAGGLIGVDSDGDGVEKSYWDINTTGQSTSAGGGGTGLTTAQMTGSAARGNMTGFDFNNTWVIKPNDYPALAWEQKRREYSSDAGKRE